MAQLEVIESQICALQMTSTWLQELRIWATRTYRKVLGLINSKKAWDGISNEKSERMVASQMAKLNSICLMYDVYVFFTEM